MPDQLVRVPLHDMQSNTYWVRGKRIDTMDGQHLQNSLRMIFRHPLATLRGIEHHAMQRAMMDEGEGWDDTQPPAKVMEILVQVRKRVQVDKLLDGNELDEIADLLATVPTIAESERAAARWLSHSPTVRAMRRQLVKRIIDGEAQVNNTDPAELEPLPPMITRSTLAVTVDTEPF